MELGFLAPERRVNPRHRRKMKHIQNIERPVYIDKHEL